MIFAAILFEIGENVYFLLKCPFQIHKSNDQIILSLLSRSNESNALSVQMLGPDVLLDFYETLILKSIFDIKLFSLGFHCANSTTYFMNHVSVYSLHWKTIIAI
jgi:hypothetical protein